MNLSISSNRISWIIILLSALLIAQPCEGKQFRSGRYIKLIFCSVCELTSLKILLNCIFLSLKDILLSRVKRQDRKREKDPINWDLVDNTLYGWTPEGSPDCRQG